jgi:hypothetical protein
VLIYQQLYQVDGFEKSLGSPNRLDAAQRLLVSVDPDIVFIGELDISLGP